MTDGRIPVTVLRRLIPLPTKRVDALGDELEVAGLWYRDADEWVFHDWHDYQPSKEQVKKDREAAAIRQRQYREKKRTNQDSQAQRNGVTHGVSNGVSHASPTRPDPTRPEVQEGGPSGPSPLVPPGSAGAPCTHGASHPRLCALCRREEPHNVI